MIAISAPVPVYKSACNNQFIVLADKDCGELCQSSHRHRGQFLTACHRKPPPRRNIGEGEQPAGSMAPTPPQLQQQKPLDRLVGLPRPATCGSQLHNRCASQRGSRQQNGHRVPASAQNEISYQHDRQRARAAYSVTAPLGKRSVRRALACCINLRSACHSPRIRQRASARRHVSAGIQAGERPIATPAPIMWPEQQWLRQVA